LHPAAAAIEAEIRDLQQKLALTKALGPADASVATDGSFGAPVPTAAAPLLSHAPAQVRGAWPLVAQSSRNMILAEASSFSDVNVEADSPYGAASSHFPARPAPYVTGQSGSSLTGAQAEELSAQQIAAIAADAQATLNSLSPSFSLEEVFSEEKPSDTGQA